MATGSRSYGRFLMCPLSAPPVMPMSDPHQSCPCTIRAGEAARLHDGRDRHGDRHEDAACAHPLQLRRLPAAAARGDGELAQRGNDDPAVEEHLGEHAEHLKGEFLRPHALAAQLLVLPAADPSPLHLPMQFAHSPSSASAHRFLCLAIPIFLPRLLASNFSASPRPLLDAERRPPPRRRCLCCCSPHCCCHGHGARTIDPEILGDGAAVWLMHLFT